MAAPEKQSNGGVEDSGREILCLPGGDLAPQETRRYLTIEEFARRSGLSTSTVRRRKKDGSLPFCQPGGSRHRVVIPEDALDRIQSDAMAIPSASAGLPALETPGNAVGSDSSSGATSQRVLKGPPPKWRTQSNCGAYPCPNNAKMS